MANNVWVFDLDGILIEVNDLYGRAIEIAFTLIKKDLKDKSPTFKEMKRRQRKLDKRMIYVINPKTKKFFLFTKSRFPTSLKLIYEIFCKEAGVEPNPKVAEAIYQTGFIAFEKKKYLKRISRFALPLFEFLHSQGDKIFIVTKGDQEVQSDKRWALQKKGVLKFCFGGREGFFIAEDAKNEYFKKIRNKHRAGRYFAVGDTYKADILPALKLGYTGIYIPSPTNWIEIGNLAKIKRHRNKKKTKIFERIIEILEKYKSLTKQR